MLLSPPRQDRKVTFTIKNLIVQETLNFGLLFYADPLP